LSDVNDESDWREKFDSANVDYRCALSAMRDAFLSQFSTDAAIKHWLDECSRGPGPVLLWVPDHDEAKFYEAAETHRFQAGITTAREDEAVNRIETQVRELPKAAAPRAVERAMARVRDRPVPARPPALWIVVNPTPELDNAG
jgi:hypothetical protein